MINAFKASRITNDQLVRGSYIILYTTLLCMAIPANIPKIGVASETADMRKPVRLVIVSTPYCNPRNFGELYPRPPGISICCLCSPQLLRSARDALAAGTADATGAAGASAGSQAAACAIFSSLGINKSWENPWFDGLVDGNLDGSMKTKRNFHCFG